MSSSKNSIFYDLGIDSSDSLSNPVEFAKKVQAKALQLKEQLSPNASIRVSERTEKFRNKALDNKEAIRDAELALQQILDLVGGLTDDSKVHLTTMMPLLSRTINGDIEGAAYNEYRDEDDEPMDKKTTHMMYIELRRVFNLWVSFQNNYFDGDDTPKFQELSAIPGNFSSSQNGTARTKSFITFQVDGMEFYSHSGLQRYLNQKFPSLNLILIDKMAAIDWVNANPEYEVSIKEIKG